MVDVALPGEIGGEHGEVAVNDQIEIVIFPDCAGLRFVSHSLSST